MCRYLSTASLFPPSFMFWNRLSLEERVFLLCASMVAKLLCWHLLCNSMVRQLLKVSVWLQHRLDPEVTFKNMWTVRSLCSAQMQLLHLKKGKICSCMFPKTQQLWIGILNYCTTTAPCNRAQSQVSIFMVLQVQSMCINTITITFLLYDPITLFINLKY